VILTTPAEVEQWLRERQPGPGAAEARANDVIELVSGRRSRLAPRLCSGCVMVCKELSGGSASRRLNRGSKRNRVAHRDRG